MKKTSILNIDPAAFMQAKALYPGLPDDDAYMVVMELKRRVQSANYSFVLERLTSYSSDLTLIEVGSIVVFYKPSNGRPTFHWCKPGDIKKVDYEDYIANQLKETKVEYVAAAMEAGTDWNIEPYQSGLKALCSTFTNGVYELSSNTLDFLRRFPNVRPIKKTKESKNVREDEGGVSTPALHPLNPEDLQP